MLCAFTGQVQVLKCDNPNNTCFSLTVKKKGKALKSPKKSGKKAKRKIKAQVDISADIQQAIAVATEQQQSQPQPAQQPQRAQQQLIRLPGVDTFMPTSNTVFITVPAQTTQAQQNKPQSILMQGSIKDMSSYPNQQFYQQPLTTETPAPITIYQVQEAPGAPVIATTIAPANYTDSAVSTQYNHTTPTVTSSSVSAVNKQNEVSQAFTSQASTLTQQTVSSMLKQSNNIQPRQPPETTPADSCQLPDIVAPQTHPTPSKDISHMDLEETTALLFDLTETTPSSNRRKQTHVSRYYTPQATDMAKQKR